MKSKISIDEELKEEPDRAINYFNDFKFQYEEPFRLYS